MGEGASFHPGAMGMEVTVDIKEDGKMETTSSVYGEEPEVDESEWKIENDKILMTHNNQTGECEYKDGKITCLLYTSPSPRDYAASRMPSSA